MISYDMTYLQLEEELLSEDASEYSLSYTSEHGLPYSQSCSSVQSLPMSKNWFGDGIECPFRESMSFTSFIQFL